MTGNRFSSALTALVVSISLVAASCATVDPGAAQAGSDQVVIDLFYGTDRKPEKASMGTTAFGNERGALSFGTCEVVVNTVSNQSEFSDSASWMPTAPAKRVKDAELAQILPLAFEDLSRRMAARQSRSSDKSALVYIHGYAKSFEEVAINTARFVYEINYQGTPFMFSWPSRDSRVSYPADVATLAWSAQHFEEFLDRLAAQHDISEIHLVAHSLGNRALLGALVNFIARHHDDSEWRFGEILLIAPDIDRDLFERDTLPKLRASPSRITLYISSQDLPLNFSKQLNRYSVLGDANGQPVAYPAIETIDVSSASTVFRGHSYFRNEPSVLADISYLINERRGASRRPFLEPSDTENGRYWRLGSAPID